MKGNLAHWSVKWWEGVRQTGRLGAEFGERCLWAIVSKKGLCFPQRSPLVYCVLSTGKTSKGDWESQANMKALLYCPPQGLLCAMFLGHLSAATPGHADALSDFVTDRWVSRRKIYPRRRLFWKATKVTASSKLAVITETPKPWKSVADLRVWVEALWERRMWKGALWTGEDPKVDTQLSWRGPAWQRTSGAALHSHPRPWHWAPAHGMCSSESAGASHQGWIFNKSGYFNMILNFQSQRIYDLLITTNSWIENGIKMRPNVPSSMKMLTFPHFFLSSLILPSWLPRIIISESKLFSVIHPSHNCV